MGDPVFDAFVGPHFDPVFSNAAAFSSASDAALMNVPALHTAARKGIESVVEAAAARNDDATARIQLIEGDAGYGKTHVITSTLFQMAQKAQVAPAAFQLSADVPQAEMARWLLSSGVRELEAHHFRDQQGRPPLRRLADEFMALAEFERDPFDAAIDEMNDDVAVAEAFRAARLITRELGRKSVPAPDPQTTAAVLLAAYHGWDPARTWLLGYRGGQLGPLVLPDFQSADDHFQVVRGLGMLASAAESPLILVFDQVEATATAGSSKLLQRIITQACQLVETTPGTGLILSTLTSTLAADLKMTLPAGIQDRILKAPCTPVRLTAPSREVLRKVVDRRSFELFRRAGLTVESDVAQRVVPSWLLEHTSTRTIRTIFSDIRKYRALCLDAGHFASEEAFKDGGTGGGKSTFDFDKLWEDKKSGEYQSVVHLADHERAELLIELSELVPDELPHVFTISALVQDLESSATRVVDLNFWDNASNPVERWRVGFTDLPNKRGKFRDQVLEFLDSDAHAHPAIVSKRPIPGFDGGQPREDKRLVKLQAGRALIQLLHAGGRAVHAADEDWARLWLALQFCRERQDAPGFKDWRQQRRFLTEAAGIGELAQLVVPTEVPEVEDLQTEDLPVGIENDEDVTRPMKPAEAPGAVPSPTPDANPLDSARILIGASGDQEVRWGLDRKAKPLLPNFGLLVSGDAGQGKTQIIKALIAEATDLGCPTVIFDFKNDYGGEFAERHGFTVVPLRDGLPFNPLKLPPKGKSGAQAIEHIYEVSGVLQASLNLGDQQKAMLRQGLERAYTQLGVPLREWVQPGAVPGPAMSEVVSAIEEVHEGKATGLVNRLGLLHGLRLLPSDADAPMTFEKVVDAKLVLAFHELPNDDALKRALAELVLIQLQAHMLRGGAPRALRRLLVFDEAWRAADSDRLIAIAREGRAFGVGLVTGSQFADDLSAELTGNLASKLHLYNSDAGQRRKVVQATMGTTSTKEARGLTQVLGKLQQFEGIFRNQQYGPFSRVRVKPYFERMEEAGASVAPSS